MKVDGITQIKIDTKNKTIDFTAKDAKAAKAGVMALVDGGYYGTATGNGKEIKINTPAAAAGKAASVTVKDVHVCCGSCKNAIKKLFPDAKISYKGSGPQLTVTIQGKDLDRATVIDSLHKTGFSGTIEK